MAKYTRNSYKRKIVMFGVMIFISIALISTGFAAWVLSTQTTKESNGNVVVGQVVDASFDIQFTEITNQYGESVATTDTSGKVIPDSSKMKFCFEPKKDDETGRVRWDGTNCENLSFTFKGTITNYAYLGSLNVKMTMSEKVATFINAKDSDGKSYVNAPYIDTTDSLATTGKDLVLTEIKNDSGQSTGKAEFECTITFTWGAAFGGNNPSEYYDDSEGAGATVSDADVKAILQAFYAAFDSSDPKFTITFTATAK